MRFTTASRMTKIDRLAVDEYGLTEPALMENAGQLTARHARRHYLEDDHDCVGIVCGKGNNGADGMVVGRWLAQWGYQVEVYLMDARQEYDDLPEKQLTSLENRNKVKIQQYTNQTDLPSVDLWVDALLGTGLSGDPRSPYDQAINVLNNQPCPVVAVDVPSGLSGDDNLPYEPCVQADLTVTYGIPKQGLLLEPGHAFAGKVVAQEIGFPSELYNDICDKHHLIFPGELQLELPGRYPTAHKGAAGQLTVIGGSQEYTGAPFLVGNAASRTGSGLTSLVGPPELSRMSSASERDLIFPRTINDLLTGDEIEEHEEFVEKQDAFVVGPGLGQSEEIRDGLINLLPRLDQPVVLDADGLNNLSDSTDVLERCEEIILTPHPGEASRLLDRPIDQITRHPVESVKSLVELTDQPVVLKSSRPVVGHPDGTISVNVTGTAALAKGGSGDVLSGMIGSFLAQSVPVPVACSLALYLHGAAGRRASERLDTVSVRSEDIIEDLPEAIDALETGEIPDWFPVKPESQQNEVLNWNPFPT